MIRFHISKFADPFRTMKATYLRMFLVATAFQAAQAVIAHPQEGNPESQAQIRMMRAEIRHDGLDREGTGISNFFGFGLDEVIDTDCQWEDWSDWSVCQFTCGEGISMRYRKVLRMAEGSGKACDNNNREERDCTMPACPIDCVFNDWADWTECSATCGDATRYQRRTSQPAQFGGLECTGLEEKSEVCQQAVCPVDCEFSDWHDWGGCSKTCGGGGKEERTRAVMTPASGGGKPCEGDQTNMRDCGNISCPEDCTVGDWSAWDLCSVSCGTGTTTRKRSVTKQQAFGGAACPNLTETHSCNPGDFCPVDCVWSDWADWQSCAASCGETTQKRIRTQKVKSNALGTNCTGEAEEQVPCSLLACPVDCTVGDWGTWDLCSVSCGTGTTTRKRSVTQQVANGGAECPTLTETHPCSPGGNCPINCIWSDWADWQSCGASCGETTKKRTRSEIVRANELGTNCSGDAVESVQCNLAACMIDCSLTDWQEWSACSVSCGPGITERSRSVAVAAANGGKECSSEDQLYEKKYCSLPSCPVDCEWTDWTEWEACSVTCGGKSSRSRLVKTVALYSGKDCTGASSEERDCEHAECPVDCSYSDWTAWQSCSISCGEGSQKRDRVVRIEPSHGGAPCTGDLEEAQSCTEKPCPVDCSFQEWGDWEACTSSCGSGVHKRSREKIEALNGGADCNGTLTQSTPCPPLPECPVDCLWEDWTTWSDCSVSCGIGAITRLRKRAHYEAFGGHVCYGTEDDVAVCELSPCPLDCFLEDWAPWSDCSTSCGNGTHVRTRSLTFAAYGGKECVNPQMQDNKACDVAPCPVHCQLSDWTKWTGCSKTCGGGLSSRERTEKVSAMYGGDICSGVTSMDQACNAQPCPVDCQWGQWTDFDACTTTCGGGKAKRSRIIWVSPSHGGVECDGSTEDEEICNEHPCPVDCRLGDWSVFTTCSETCGGGVATRSRSIVTPQANGGLPCVGETGEELHCNTQACPVDCKLDEWSPWSSCTLTCGGGTMTRQRTVLEPSSYGGAACTGESIQEAACGQVQCPVDCVVTDWSPWSGCSTTCGGGVNLRFRIVQVESAFGGTTCPSGLTETLECNEAPCPVDCKLGDWRDWETCSTTCGAGKRVRTRLRENERFGGLPCKEDLIDEDECYVAPEKPLCPDLPTAAPTSSGTVDATSASSTDAKTAAVKAAEAMEGMPIPAGVVDQVAKIAATGDSDALRKYLAEVGVNPEYFQGVLGNLTSFEAATAEAAKATAKAAMHTSQAVQAAAAVKAAEAATAAEAVKVAPPKMTAEAAAQVARLTASGDIEAVKRYLREINADPMTFRSVLSNLTSSQGDSIENALGNVTAKQAEGPKIIEVLRLEGNLYLYTPSADDFVSNAKSASVLKDLIAAKAHVESKDVEVTLSIPQRPLESEWQKKSKGNLRCEYKIHVYSETGSAAEGDAVIAHLKQLDETVVENKLSETCKATALDCELVPISMTMRPYKMP